VPKALRFADVSWSEVPSCAFHEEAHPKPAVALARPADGWLLRTQHLSRTLADAALVEPAAASGLQDSMVQVLADRGAFLLSKQQAVFSVYEPCPAAVVTSTLLRCLRPYPGYGLKRRSTVWPWWPLPGVDGDAKRSWSG